MSFPITEFLLALVPLLTLLACLVQDTYPGERMLDRLRRPARGREAVGMRDASSPPELAAGIRGGRLIACSLAGRGPPRFKVNPTL